MQNKIISRLCFSAAIWALCVVIVGAYVRLSDAGLGCPDWPGCYGHIGVPLELGEVQVANDAYPERPVEAAKAWKEMFHRYIASGLGLLIVLIGVLSYKAKLPSKLPYFLIALVIFQGILGMWTVTLLVKPAVVTAHLFGGLATTGLLVLLGLKTKVDNALSPQPKSSSGVKLFAWFGLTILLIQIFLGGWVSTNYAALSCPDFPTCQGQMWPQNMNFSDGFTLWRGLGTDYEGGVLPNESRVAIHMAHRVGAIVAATVLLLLGFLCRNSVNSTVKHLGIMLMSLVGLQVLLGILNIVLSLPLAVATAHNGVAACLVIVMVALLRRLYLEPSISHG